MRRALNVAHACITEDANGPGRRFTVWMQGCRLACPGCFNPGLQPLGPGRVLPPEELAREAAAVGPWEGVTLSGGEPFLQASAAVFFLEALKTRVGAFTTIAFTGYRLAELRRRGRAATELLARVDLLVDGRYRRERAARLPLRGSSNQRLLVLTPQGEALRERIERAPPVGCEVRIGEAGEVILTGFPPEDLVRRVQELFPEV